MTLNHFKVPNFTRTKCASNEITTHTKWRQKCTGYNFLITFWGIFSFFLIMKVKKQDIEKKLVGWDAFYAKQRNCFPSRTIWSEVISKKSGFVARKMFLKMKNIEIRQKRIWFLWKLGFLEVRWVFQQRKTENERRIVNLYNFLAFITKLNLHTYKGASVFQKHGMHNITIRIRKGYSKVSRHCSFTRFRSSIDISSDALNTLGTFMFVHGGDGFHKHDGFEQI